MLFFLILPLIQLGCNSNERPDSFDSKEQYLEWIHSEESGFVKKSSSKDIDFELVFFPKELDFKTKDGEQSNDLSQIEEIKTFQFIVHPKDQSQNILRLNLEDENAYKKRIQILEFGHSNMFFAISNKDTLRPVFTHYENFRGIKNELLIHVHFESNRKLQEDLEVIYIDKLFHSGNHHFNFAANHLNNTPTLKQSLS